MSKRKIPNLYITIQEGIDFSAIQENIQIKDILYNSVVDAFAILCSGVATDHFVLHANGKSIDELRFISSIIPFTKYLSPILQEIHIISKY